MNHTYAAYNRPTSGQKTNTDWKWSAGNKFSKETYRKKKPLFYLSPLVHYLLMPCSFLIYASCIFINIRNTSIFRSKSHFTVSFFSVLSLHAWPNAYFWKIEGKTWRTRSEMWYCQICDLGFSLWHQRTCRWDKGSMIHELAWWYKNREEEREREDL